MPLQVLHRNKEVPNNTGTQVDNVVVDQNLEPGIRVTVAMRTDRCLEIVKLLMFLFDGWYSLLKVVPSYTPREEGSYWGYKLQYAPNINSVFKDFPFEGEYDHKVGTSVHDVVLSSSELTIPTFRHLLIAFGGLAGLEEYIEDDVNLKVLNLAIRQWFSYPCNSFTV
ncbi:hypothetical protein MKX03_018710 [Papaver bracteatum]|nr:hypothetical protein MKX03_018710 [Papaver bracteatum]